MPPPERKRVAVVGSGIAGLTAAYLLSREHEVTLFEREAVLGMDAHSRDAHGARMDIPLRVFSESYYPNLCRLYQLLGIRYHTADYSFSCSHGAADGTAAVAGSARRAYFRYSNLFYRGMAIPLPSLGLLLAPHRVPKYLGLTYQFMRFLRSSPDQIQMDGMSELSLVRRRRYPTPAPRAVPCPAAPTSRHPHHPTPAASRGLVLARNTPSHQTELANTPASAYPAG